jgi:predicted GIY-YIG superfamily endonuclease
MLIIGLTKEICQEEALKYKYKKDFLLYSSKAYSYAKKHGWFNDICKHMVRPPSKKLKWTKEKCIEGAKLYNTKIDFQKNSKGAYLSAFRNGWISECYEHMIEVRKPNGYWTKERCQEEALKYKTITEFRKNSGSAYEKSLEKKWNIEICSHMIHFGNYKNRCIYSYEFSDNSVYIGLTYNIENRKYRRKKDKSDSVTKHIKETNLVPIIKQLTDYIDIDKAIKMENYYVEKYKLEGWKILNKAKTGSIGGNIIKWSYENCKIEALKYKTRKEFSDKNGLAYVVSISNNWLDEFYPKEIKIYDENYFRIELSKYNNKNELTKNNNTFYRKIIKSEYKYLLNEFFPNEFKIYDEEYFITELSKHKSRLELITNDKSLYGRILKTEYKYILDKLLPNKKSLKNGNK